MTTCLSEDRRCTTAPCARRVTDALRLLLSICWVVGLVVLGLATSALAHDVSHAGIDREPMVRVPGALTSAPAQSAVKAAQPIDTNTRQSLALVMTTAPDTPQGKGLLAVALSEASTAVKQAWTAEQAPKDLAAMQAGARGVLRAIDPSLSKDGAGLGYGVRPAVLGLIQQVMTLESADTKADVVRTARPALVAAQNVVTWCDAAATLARQILAATRAEDAAAVTHGLSTLTRQLAAGTNTSRERHAIPAASDGGLLFVQLQLQMLKVGRDAAAAPPAPVVRRPPSEQPRPPIPVGPSTTSPAAVTR
jgi:hypothetical protein